VRSRAVAAAEGEQFVEVQCADGSFPQRKDRGQVEVIEMAIPRHGDVTRVSADAQIGHPVIEGQAVKRGVGLDESPVRLLRKVGKYVVERAHQDVPPGRDLV
jgi:hypothetical protein